MKFSTICRLARPVEDLVEFFRTTEFEDAELGKAALRKLLESTADPATSKAYPTLGVEELARLLRNARVALERVGELEV